HFPTRIGHQFAEMGFVIGRHPLALATQTVNRERDDQRTRVEGVQQTIAGLLINLLKARNDFEQEREIDLLRRTRLRDIARLGLSLYMHELEIIVQKID